MKPPLFGGLEFQKVKNVHSVANWKSHRQDGAYGFEFKTSL